jgi:hypothetical protein
MRNIETNKTGRALVGLAAIALWIGACSSGPNSGRAPGDGSVDVGSDASVDAGDSSAACSEQQRTYVDQILAPELQTDVAATVQAVLGADGFARDMPFCSGPRPAAR